MNARTVNASTMEPTRRHLPRAQARGRAAGGSVLMALLAMAGFVLSVAPAEAASSRPLTGSFRTFFPQAGQGNNIPSCPEDTFCALGTLKGFGPAELDIFDTNFEPVPNTNCLSFDKQDDVVLADGSTLVLTGTGQLCFPGNSGNVPPSPNNRDYGHPSTWLSDLTIDGSASTGLFHGATGAATEAATIAGGVGVFNLDGTLSR